MVDLPDIARAEAAIIAETNAFRRAERLGTVAPNAELTAAARKFAEYLARSGRFAHDADGRRPAERIAAAGYKYCSVAENLSLNQSSRGFTTAALATAVVEGWKASPGHRRNLVDPQVTEIGVGVAKAADQAPKYLSVQLFGRPDRLKITFRVENRSKLDVAYVAMGKSTSVSPRGIVTHSACAEGSIVFGRAGGFFTGFDVGVRLPVRNGDVFKLVDSAGGGVKVETVALPGGAR